MHHRFQTRKFGSLAACAHAAAALIIALPSQATSQAKPGQPGTLTSLGVIGPVYAIAEPSLLAVIQDQLRRMQASGELDRMNQASQNRVRRQIESPKPVDGLGRATKPRAWLHDPSIEVPYPVTDAEGRVIVPPGTRINPLDVVALSQPLLFIDARDPDQIRHAQKVLTERQGRLKLILTGGSYLDLMRRWKHTVYFDQQGHLTSRLGIRQVPALVTQEGQRLRIDERL
jgi:conjugal transfer pilus assembly protein TraW